MVDRLIFLGHKVSDDPQLNRAKALIMMRHLIDSYPDLTFVAPWIEYLEILNDGDADHRNRGMRDDIVVLKRCDEYWMIGPIISNGMREELRIAMDHGLRVVNLTGQGIPPLDLKHVVIEPERTKRLRAFVPEIYSSSGEED